MPELPWKKWYPQDWKSDPKLDQCSAATRGIWADAISTMMLLGTDHLTGTDEQMARFCRCSNAEIQQAHKELSASQTANVSIQNGCKKWQSRRLHRELEISELRREAVFNRWHKSNTKHHTKALQTENTNRHTRSASASASVSGKNGEGDLKGKPDLVPTSEQIYMAYPRHESKLDGIAAIDKAIKKGFGRSFLLERTVAYAKTQPPRSRFTPLPASWFNAERFNDDPREWEREDSKPSNRPKKPWEIEQGKPKFNDLYPT